ncbi:MAG: hypothetical protein DI498_11750 [Paracoccus denitrificans]|nr:MAG: hypothetical protein DI498_11750 [Paracoccus denitrificans]PZO83416.1 MAG: hypothetical protein DI633_11750 [Paracoccus denitrificans]
MRKLMVMVVIGLMCTPAVGQDFNYTPGWANTHNFNQLHNRSSGKSKATGKRKAKRLEVCRYDMLSASERRVMERQGRAKIAELGQERGLKWMDGYARRTMAKMVADGRCKAE